MTLCVFKVPYSCGESRGRKRAKKALKKAYGESIKFNLVEDRIIAEGDAVNQAKIIAELQKEKIVKVSTCTSGGGGGGGGGGGSNADGAKEATNGGGENKDGGNMGLMVPPMGQCGPNYYHPGYAMTQHCGYPQQPWPMDNDFSHHQNANGCTIM